MSFSNSKITEAVTWQLFRLAIDRQLRALADRAAQAPPSFHLIDEQSGRTPRSEPAQIAGTASGLLAVQ